jgi:hypothetical protein
VQEGGRGQSDPCSGKKSGIKAKGRELQKVKTQAGSTVGFAGKTAGCGQW